MSMTNPYTRHIAYRRAAEDFDIEEELERSRIRRRENDARAVEDAQMVMEQYITPRPPPQPAPRPQPQQEGINWGKAIGEVLGKVGTAVVGKLTEPETKPVVPVAPLPALAPPDLPVPVVDPNPPPIPFDLGLRPAQTGHQLADANEYLRRREEVEGRPAAVGVADAIADDERRRRALVPASIKQSVETSPIGDKLTNAVTPSPELLPRSRPEDVKPSRGLPAPGEEAVNDLAFAELLKSRTGVVDGGDVHTRARVARPREFVEKRIAEIEANPARENSNGRWRGALDTAIRAAARSLASGARPAEALGALGAGFGVGVLDKSTDERLAEQDAVARLRAGLQGQYERESAGLKLEDARTSNRLKGAQADYYEQRPEADAVKRADALAKNEQSRIFRALASLKGQELDPTDESVQQLQRDAARVNIPFDVASFNNSKGNVVRYTRTDPANPEQTVEVERNVVTGEETVLGQKGFQATRNSEGRTAADVASDDDRDRGFAATQDFRAQMFGLSSARLQESMLNGLTGRAAKVFGTKTTGLFAQRNALEKQIDGYRTRASKREIMPAEAERRIGEIQKKVDDLTGQIDDARSEAVGGMASSPAPVSPSSTAPRGRVSRKNFGTLREDNPALRGKSDAEVEAALKAAGVVVY